MSPMPLPALADPMQIRFIIGDIAYVSKINLKFSLTLLMFYLRKVNEKYSVVQNKRSSDLLF